MVSKTPTQMQVINFLFGGSWRPLAPRAAVARLPDRLPPARLAAFPMPRSASARAGGQRCVVPHAVAHAPASSIEQAAQQEAERAFRVRDGLCCTAERAAWRHGSGASDRASADAVPAPRCVSNRPRMRPHA